MRKMIKKELRRDKRIAARITEELYDAAAQRAYEEHKTVSTLVVEALMQYLDFKMPPRKK